MTSVRTTQLLNNSLGLVGQDLKDVLSPLAKSINSNFADNISYILIDRANTGEWLANVGKK
ncbi:TPA: hypothetical protein VBA44_001329 [Streptococcus agalactiae]|nr:hypothetical protein [Streptococcus agalactiae]HEO6606325.1 hypothetical protein [Streptococcus agalactiae]HEO6632009.1 hypothetical protein [Streptococcus agalactiae]